MIISLREKEKAEKEEEGSASLSHSIQIPQVLALGQGQLVGSQAPRPNCPHLFVPACVRVCRNSSTPTCSVVVSSDVISPSSDPHPQIEMIILPNASMILNTEI